MGDSALIRAYLLELRVALARAGVPRGLRPRIVAEVDDHLRDAVAEGVAEGEAPTLAAVWAVIRFGEAGPVAQRFADELSPTLAWGATVWSVLAFVAACLVWAAALALPVGQVAPWENAVPPTGVRFVGMQICFVVALLTGIRALRQRRHGVVVAERMRFVRRGVWILNALVAGLLAPEVVGVALHPGAVGASVRTMFLTFGLVVAVMLTAAALLRSLFRLPGVPDEMPQPAWSTPPAGRTSPAGTLSTVAATSPTIEATSPPVAEWAFDDVAAAARFVWHGLRRRVPWADDLADVVGMRARAARSAALARIPGHKPRHSPREHPHRVCVAFALFVGVVFAAVHGVVDPGPLSARPSMEQLALAVLSGLILLATEATAVVGAYALLGGFLGLRPRPEARTMTVSTREVPFSRDVGTLAHE